jgi:hypothetical protein
MIGLFFLRLILLGVFLSLLLGWPAGIIGIFAMLFSPFVIFTEMQIRPDNLMLTVFLAGLVITTIALKKNNAIIMGLASFVTAWSVLLLMKIAPSIFAYGTILGIYFLFNKKWKMLIASAIGAVLAFITFSLPFVFYGVWGEMMTQVFLESVKSYSGVFEFPVPFTFFYHPSNEALYGLPGKPLTWLFNLALPLLGAAGLFVGVFSPSHIKKTEGWKHVLFFILLFSGVFQWIFLTQLESVFLQHYIMVDWVYVIGTTILIMSIIHSLRSFPVGQLLVCIFLIIFAGFLAKTTIQANTLRANWNADGLISWYKNVWNQIPEGDAAFPNILFRPLAWPVPTGHFIGNIPKSILARLPKISDTLEARKTKHLLVDQYLFDRLPDEAKVYIKSHYTLLPTDPAIYVRMEK